MRRILLAAPLALAACPVQTSLVSVPVDAETPAVALDTTAADASYGSTAGSCFVVPGTARGTGFAAQPELALGAVWTHEAGCDVSQSDSCVWEPSLSVYQGSARVEGADETDVFSGFVRFDDSSGSRTMARLFGVPVASGAFAEVIAQRSWVGHVDYRDANVAAWATAWSPDEDEVGGLAWQVTVFEWTANFLAEYDYDDELADGERAYDIDGTLYRRSADKQRGYEVYACVIPL